MSKENRASLRRNRANEDWAFWGDILEPKSNFAFDLDPFRVGTGCRAALIFMTYFPRCAPSSLLESCSLFNPAFCWDLPISSLLIYPPALRPPHPKLQMKKADSFASLLSSLFQHRVFSSCPSLIRPS